MLNYQRVIHVCLDFTICFTRFHLPARTGPMFNQRLDVLWFLHRDIHYLDVHPKPDKLGLLHMLITHELESHLQGFRRISPINPTWSIQDLHIKQIILAKWITIRIKHIWTTLNSPVNHQIIRIPEVFTWIFSDFSHHGFNWIHMAMGQYL